MIFKAEDQFCQLYEEGFMLPAQHPLREGFRYISVLNGEICLRNDGTGVVIAIYIVDCDPGLLVPGVEDGTVNIHAIHAFAPVFRQHGWMRIDDEIS